MTLTSFNGVPADTGQANAQWQNKGEKPCIALMGEFSAGKTTLINLMCWLTVCIQQ